MNKKEPVVNLDDLEKNSTLELNELIYQDACERLVYDILYKVSTNVKTDARGKNHLLHQPCFFINGGRGSGKTTLLRAVKHAVCSKDTGTGNKVALLAEIDPTELAETENFFIHILGRVQKMLNRVRSKEILSEKKKALYCKADKYMRHMSRGLGLLVRRPEDFCENADAEYFVQTSVADCVSGAELKKTFAALVQTLCELQNVDALLVTVDDADMNFNKCSEVFETVRKYLINARMAFIFAGDLKLYTMVVRGMQMNHFGKLALAYDPKRDEHRNQLLDTLEDQYVMKLFPVENRVMLSDFSGVMRMSLWIKTRDEEKENLGRFLKETLGQQVKGFSYPVWKGFIGMLPTRSALQLIAYWKKHIKGNSSTAEEVWSEGIRQVTMHALIKHRIDTRKIYAEGVEALIPAVIAHSKALNQGISGAGLTSDVGTETQQMVSMFLAAEVVRKVRKPADLLQYIMRVFTGIYSHTRGESEADYVEPLEYNENSWGNECTARLLPYIENIPEGGKMFADGVVPLMSYTQSLDTVGSDRISVQQFVQDILNYTRAAKNKNSTCAALAVYHAFGRVVEYGGSIHCLSVFNLLNTVAKLIEIQHDDQEMLKNEILQILENGGNVPTVSRESSGPRKRMPLSLRRGYMQEYLGGDTCSFYELFLGDMMSSVNEVIDMIVEWKQRIKDIECVLQAYELRNIWALFMRGCQMATDSAKIKSDNSEDLAEAGKLFMYYLDAFFESAYYGKNNKLRNLMDAIAACPLCMAWLSGMVNAEQIYKKCNSVNIGPMRLDMSYRRAMDLCVARVKKESVTCISRAEVKFKHCIEKYIKKVRDAWDNHSRYSRRECELEILPLYEQVVKARQIKGRRKGGLGGRERKQFIDRFMKSIEKGTVERELALNNINQVRENFEMNFKDALESDLKEREMKALNGAEEIRDEKEFVKRLNREFRETEENSEMYLSPILDQLSQRCSYYAGSFNQWAKEFVTDKIEEKKSMLADELERLK